MSQTISSAIAWWASNTPDTVAVRIQEEDLTYGAFHAWGDRVAHDLRARGLKPGDRVGIAAGNSLAFCALVLGVLRVGGIVLPISMRLTAFEAADILADAQPSLVFADDPGREIVQGAAADRPQPLAHIDALRGAAPVAFDAHADPQAPVVIITTSGSTAKPKGVVYSNRSMTSSACEFAVHLPGCTGPGAKTITLSPLSTSAGFVQLVTFTVLGCTMLIEPRFDAERVLALIEREQVSVYAAVPVFLERMAACPGFDAADLSSLRLVTVGGAPVTHSLLAAYQRKGIVIRQMYGQTEAGGFATVMPAGPARHQPEKCGRGGLFTEIRILGDDGRFAPAGTPGEILIRGPGVMVGYWGNPQATAEALREGWLHTGDIGVLDEEGLLTFVDRKKDIIISGGLNISAAEVERVVGLFEGIEEVAVIAASDVRFGETPLAIVHARSPIKVADLVQHCNARLADYKVPRYVVVSPEPLPRLATGKLSKRALRDAYRDAEQQLAKVR